MRSGGDSTKINNLFNKFKEDLIISNKYLKLGILSIFFKISKKIFQLKIYNKKIENKYIKDLNNL